MKISTLSVLALFIVFEMPAVASAASKPDLALVQIDSTLCGNANGLEGSGVLLKENGTNYVVTSASVVLGDDSACTTVRNSSGASAAAKLLAQDWGYGLSLLRLDIDLPGSVPLVRADFTQNSPATNDPVSLHGFSSSDFSASVLIPQSDRHFLVFVPFAVELVGARVEKNMIGGGGFDGSGKLLGLISHQYLKMQEGRPTRAYEWDSVPGHIETQPLLIPATVITRWLNTYFANPSGFAPVIRVDVQDQLNGKDRIHVQGLDAESVCPKPAPGLSVFTPIGGGDGAGIGGDSPQDPACRILFTLDSGAASVPFPNNGAWLTTIQSRLKESRSAKFLYFAQRDPQSNGLAASVARSNFEFLTRLFQGGWTPILSYSPALIATQGTPLWDAQDKSQDIQNNIQVYYLKGCSLLTDSQLVHSILFSDTPALVVPSDVDSLADENGSESQCWNFISLADHPNVGPQPSFQLGDYLQEKFAVLKADLAKIQPQLERVEGESFSLTAAFSSWVVKITSETCDHKKVFHGSGVLFQNAGKAYVLTSDHVLLHSNQGYCHSVWSPAFSSGQKAFYLVADWGHGLGLLELPSATPAQNWPQLTDFIDASVGDAVSVLGYPWGSQQLVQNSGAKVDDPRDAEDFFVQVPRVLKLSNGNGEYGMSGGPVIGANGKVVGILSDQKIDHQGGGQQNQIYAVPGSVIGNWLNRYFADPKNFDLTFFQTPANQVPDGLIVSGRLWYGYYSGDTADYPAIVISVGKTPFTAHEYRDPSGWVSQFESYVANNPNADGIEINSFYKDSIIFNGDPSPTPITGLVPFFRNMENSGKRPLGLLMSTDDWTDLVKQANGLAASAETAANAAFSAANSNLLPGTIEILYAPIEQLITVLKAADSDPVQEGHSEWQHLSGRDVHRLLEDAKYKQAWDELLVFRPQEGKNLRDLVAQIAATMDKLIF